MHRTIRLISQSVGRETVTSLNSSWISEPPVGCPSVVEQNLSAVLGQQVLADTCFGARDCHPGWETAQSGRCPGF